MYPHDLIITFPMAYIHRDTDTDILRYRHRYTIYTDTGTYIRRYRHIYAIYVYAIYVYLWHTHPPLTHTYTHTEPPVYAASHLLHPPTPPKCNLTYIPRARRYRYLSIPVSLYTGSLYRYLYLSIPVSTRYPNRRNAI